MYQEILDTNVTLDTDQSHLILLTRITIAFNLATILGGKAVLVYYTGIFLRSKRWLEKLS